MEFQERLRLNWLLVKGFIEQVYELVVLKRISLTESLKFMAEMKKNKVSIAAGKLMEELQKGSLFSEALFKCEEIHFDEVFVLFVKFAERTGDLNSVFEFLYRKYERKNDSRQKLLEASVYPLFVFLLAIGSCVFCVMFGKSLFVQWNFGAEMKVRLCKAVCGFLIFSLAVAYLFWKNLKEDKLYEAFLGMGFLTKAGVNVAQAVGYGMLLVGPDSREGKRFAAAQQRLEYGMDLKSAFGFTDDGGLRAYRGQNRKMYEAFYFARRAGEKSDVFEKIAENLKTEDERRRKVCMSLIEPMFISMTGMFLILMLVNLILPFFTEIKVI